MNNAFNWYNFTFSYFVCTKVQIIELIPLASQVQVHKIKQVFITCMHTFRGRMVYNLNLWDLLHFQVYYVCSLKLERNLRVKTIASTANFDAYQWFFAPINVSSIDFIREWVSLVYATPTSSKIGKYVSHPFGLQMSKVA
jgi:hypothetical protein